MNLKANFYRLIVLAVFLTCGLCPAMAQESKKFKVLVVFSYEDSYPSTADYKEGMESILKKDCEIKYFHMDTKKNFEGGHQKAKEALALYQEFQPHGVIVADDDAQAMFVVPYLMDKVKTPVMFCGVNADAKEYKYPASNVSGILERLHINESIAIIQQLVPSVKTIGYLMKESPTAKFVSWQINSESESYPAKSVPPKYPKTLKEAMDMTNELKAQCDLLFVVALQGITDDKGNSMSEKDVVAAVTKAFGKPTTTCVSYNMKYGVLGTVIHRMQEQGETSANMLLKAMNGTPVSQLPITKNHQGKRMINATVLKELGITPKPAAIKGAELVKTEN